MVRYDDSGVIILFQPLVNAMTNGSHILTHIPIICLISSKSTPINHKFIIRLITTKLT